MLALTGVKLYSPISFPLLQMIPFILPTVSLAAEKTVQGYDIWCYWLIMIAQLIEQGQVTIHLRQ